MKGWGILAEKEKQKNKKFLELKDTIAEVDFMGFMNEEN